LLTSIALSARTYVDPVATVPRAVDQRKWVVPLLWLMLTAAAAGAAFADRLDAAKEVLPKMAEKGELAKASEREVSEEIEQTQRIALVLGVAKAVFGMPLAVLLIAVALKILAWLIGRKSDFGALFTAAAVAMLPVALYYLLAAVVALRQDVIAPSQAGKLMISSLQPFFTGGGPGRGRVLAAIDFFNLWSAGLLGLGFAAATKLTPWRGVLLGLFLYVLFAAAILVGLPGMMGEMK
jgi:hypothetical protein